MGLKYQNNELLEFTEGPILIWDASVTRFDTYLRDHRLCIDIYFSLMQGRSNNEGQFKICFIDVLEYSFYWNASHSFYNVERCKFFVSDEGYYISLDPYDESEDILEEDQDIILCKEIEGYFL